MADSDNSRTLPTVTRGDFHSSVPACLPTYPHVAAHRKPGFSGCANDPAVAAWQHWRAAWTRLSESTRHQQQLETALFSGELSSSAERDGRSAYNDALEDEDRAALAEELAAQALWPVPVASLPGVIAKLDAIVNRGQPSSTCVDEPWAQIRMVIADLLRIDPVDARLGRMPERERQPA
ncbi:hypothetical protein ASD01_08255 [Ensifer sp. Root423]|uniref:hypothetical protein n=1 Tax=Ensifer sp. Root423 TaxID=1736534 RepID=UPI000712FB4F|nr:hypothetical protein [Ensifer sp. Root423]KQX16512.1 hypothetical protein ASD01_08255 [Ensifer sp. Root423]